MTGPLLRVSRFDAGYGGKMVVRDVSFSLATGQTAALLGLNGSGKTTLIKGICGLIPSAGDCLVGGGDPRRMRDRARARRMAYIPQRGGISFSISLLDVVLMGFHAVLGVLEPPGKARERVAMEALRRVGLAGRAGEDFQALSEGQRQLVILARALVQDTPLLLLDEPDSALDFTNRHMVLSALRDIVHQSGKAALLSLHDANFALRYCDRLLLMRDGRLVADIEVAGTPRARLEAALSEIYGQVSLLEHRGQYVMVGT